MTGTLTRLLTATAATLALAGCATTQSAADEPVDPCDQIHDDANTQADAVKALTDKMQELQDAGMLEPVDEKWNTPWWANGTYTRPGPGQAVYTDLQSKAQEASRLWGRIIVNNDECFPSVDVAKAQEYLELTN